MHARVTTISGSTDQLDEGVAGFRDNVVPALQEEDGGKGALLLVDRQTGKGIAITLWEDEQAMQASEERANALRAQASGEMGATEAPQVERYEVAVYEV